MARARPLDHVIAVVLMGGLAYGGWRLLGAMFSAEPKPPLAASVARNDRVLVVTNRDSAPWSDCTIELNRHWKLRRPAVYGAMELPVTAFTRTSGERFNPLTHAIREVAILCTEGAWFGRP